MGSKTGSPKIPAKPYQRDVLNIFINFCPKLQAVAAELLNTGVDEIDPDDRNTNLEKFSVQLGYLLAAATFASDSELLDEGVMDNAMLDAMELLEEATRATLLKNMQERERQTSTEDE